MQARRQASAATHKLRNLQAMRAIAALIVMVMHLVVREGALIDSSRETLHFITRLLASAGGAGVDTFFVISGFIMCGVAGAGRERQGVAPRRGGSAWRFLVRRAARIYPLYWVVIASLFTMYGDPAYRAGLTQIVSSPSIIFLTTTKIPLLLQAWTLAFEVFFYCVVTAAILVSPRHITRVLWGWIAIEACLVVASIWWPGAQGVWGAVCGSFLVKPQILEFGIGVLVYSACRRSGAGYAKPAQAAAALLFLTGVSLCFWQLEYNGSLSDPQRLLFYGCPAGLLIYGLTVQEFRTGQALPVWLQTIGDWSYSIYLWHFPVMDFFRALWTLAGFSDDPWWGTRVALECVMTLLLSVGSYYLVERPAMALGRLITRQHNGTQRLTLQSGMSWVMGFGKSLMETLSSPPARQNFWLGTPVLLAGFAILVCLRMPDIIVQGRFWAEEGKYFFTDAWTQPPLQALFFDFGGYLNLAATGTTLAARWLMPLSLAPYLTITVALLVQLCAPLLLLTARDGWLQPAGVRLAALALILFVPDSEEVWLQTLHCQFHLTLCCAIILVLQPAGGRVAAFRLGLLLLSPLCGPTAVVLLPLFLLRAGLERNVPRLAQSATLAAGAFIQLAFFLHAIPGRAYTTNPFIFACIATIRHLDAPLLGIPYAERASERIRARLASGHIPIKASVLPFLVFIPYGLTAWFYRRSTPAIWFFCGFALIAAVCYFGAVGGSEMLMMTRTDGRYVFVPQALLALSVLALASGLTGWRAWPAWGVVICLIAVGGMAFIQPNRFSANGPSWRAEVAAWRVDPTHALQIWPAGWTMLLPPHPK